MDAPLGCGASVANGAVRNTSQTLQTPDAPVAPLKPGVETAPRGLPVEVSELHRRFKEGELKDVSLEMPGVKITDLEQGLRYYFSKTKLTETERHDLLGIAKAVVGERKTVVF
jgi:hypothetical protein